MKANLREIIHYIDESTLEKAKNEKVQKQESPSKTSKDVEESVDKMISNRMSKAYSEWKSNQDTQPFNENIEKEYQNHYNLLYREDERELLPICKQMKVSLMPYSPLAAGHLARPQWKSESLRGTTDRVAMGKYDKTEAEDMQIVKRVAELAEKYNCKMSQIAIAWQWAKGILSPIIGATKTQYLDDSAGAFDIKLTAEDLAYLEEPYVPHEIVGAIDKNPAQGVILLDKKK